MKKTLKIQNMSKLIAFCLSSLILVYFSKYVFGKGDEILIEKQINLKSSESNDVVKGKLGSFHIVKIKKDVNINTGKITINNVGDNPIRLYGITVDNINGNNVELADDIINVEIDGTGVFHGKLSDIINGNKKTFKIIKKLQPRANNKISIKISNTKNNTYIRNEIRFDLYILATIKDEIDTYTTEIKNRMYLGGFYSQDDDKYINEFWGECLEKDNEIWFYYNKTSHNKGFEYIVVDIKNHNKDAQDIRVICFKKQQMISVKGIDEESVKVDWDNNIIKIKRRALSQDYSGFDIRIGSAKSMASRIQVTSYKFYSYK